MVPAAEQGSPYLPGYADDAMRMLSARTTHERAGFVLPHLHAGMRVLDLGCGPGVITTGLANAVAPGGVVLGADLSVAQLALGQSEAAHATSDGARLGWVAGQGAALPIRSGVLDVAFAHALFEHVCAPATVLAELRRCLRAGGVLAVCSSDWGAATIEPWTPEVDTALRGYWTLRERTGTDPFAGRSLAGHVRAAGFAVLAVEHVDRVDMGYGELGAYLRNRLTSAALHDPSGRRTDGLAEAVRAATAWAEAKTGRFTQRWVEVLATAP